MKSDRHAYVLYLLPLEQLTNPPVTVISFNKKIKKKS